MNILFITPSYKPAYIYGGPTVTTALLAEELVRLGHSVVVLTTTANGKKELDVLPGKPVITDGVQVIYFKRITKDHTHISPSLWRYLRKHAKEYNGIHIHSWWNILVIVAAWICKRQGIQPVLSPHGMFSNYILSTNNAFKKKIVHGLIGKRLLRNTSLHVSTAMEWEESQKVIPGWKGSIIPNLIELPSITYPRQTNKVFTIGFLSRIDPKKGLDILIQALSKIDFPFQLLVAGTGEAKYIAYLKQLARDCGIEDKIQWVGWKNGEAKFEFLAQLDLFALISHSENFAIVVIESLAVGTPVFISKKVGLFNYIRDNHLGWLTDINAIDVWAKLKKIYYDKAALQSILSESPDVVRKDFNAVYLAKQYVNLYKD